MPTPEMVELLDALQRLEQALPGRPDVQWQETIDEWIEDVRVLLERLRSWLKPALEGDKPLIQWEPLQVAIAEGDRPVYHAPGARLIGTRDRFVEIVPKARAVFNAMGRVDLVSRKGRAMLARFSRGHWSFVWNSGKEGNWESAELTEATFAEVLREMLG